MASEGQGRTCKKGLKEKRRPKLTGPGTLLQTGCPSTSVSLVYTSPTPWWFLGRTGRDLTPTGDGHGDAGTVRGDVCTYVRRPTDPPPRHLDTSAETTEYRNEKRGSFDTGSAGNRRGRRNPGRHRLSTSDRTPSHLRPGHRRGPWSRRFYLWSRDPGTSGTTSWNKGAT